MPLARKEIAARWAQLKNERSNRWSHWRELSDFLSPWSGRFATTDRNKTKRPTNIYDNTGTRALRTLGSGLMAGVTSPARPWFRLGVSDPDLNESPYARVWLDDVAKRILRVFAKSNTYRALHTIYDDLALFGSGASILVPDFQTVIHHYPVPVGEFAIALNSRGVVDTIYREFEMTVAQVVQQFGIENVSSSVREMHRKGNLDAAVTVIHAIEPRADRDTSKMDDRNMPYRSVYIEAAGSEGDPVLSESGFRRFPALCPRWAVTGGDTYGHSPGMDALGDVKSLQHLHLRKAQAVDFQTMPPLQAPMSMANRDVEMMPGGVTYVDPAAPNAGIRPSFEVRLDLSHLAADIQQTQYRINTAFYADLFLMLANAGPNTRMTATEVAERHEEKLLMLGPVLEGLHNGLLEPLVDFTLTTMMEGGLLPPPPPELAGQETTVEFVSIMAQAQRAVGTTSIDRFMGNLGAIAQMRPEVLDKIDVDKWAEVYSDALGVDPRLIVPEDRVTAIRDARAKAMAAKEVAAMQQQQAATVRDLASAQTAQPSALTDVMGMFSGYNMPPSAAGV